MVYQVIEKAGNLGIWTKDIRTQTNIQQQALNKIFKVSRNNIVYDDYFS
jgi:DNA-directed RNA polymerase III subunit RPC6